MSNPCRSILAGITLFCNRPFVGIGISWEHRLRWNPVRMAVILERTVRVLAFGIAIYEFYKEILIQSFPFLEQGIGLGY